MSVQFKPGSPKRNSPLPSVIIILLGAGLVYLAQQSEKSGQAHRPRKQENEAPAAKKQAARVYSESEIPGVCNFELAVLVVGQANQYLAFRRPDVVPGLMKFPDRCPFGGTIGEIYHNNTVYVYCDRHGGVLRHMPDQFFRRGFHANLLAIIADRVPPDDRFPAARSPKPVPSTPGSAYPKAEQPDDDRWVPSAKKR